MKANKGFPYHEAKKPKTKVCEDKRPHLNQYPAYYQSKQESKHDPKFCIPDIRNDCVNWSKTGEKRNKWTKPEIYALIDHWAEIAWGTGSDTHKKMSKLAGYFGKLWIRQGGRCAITGIKLFGAPGLLGRGIGIDIINHDFGIRKGNLRLVSAPLAKTRWYLYPNRTQTVADLDPKRYAKWPIFWAVLKHIQWELKRKQTFKNLPVNIQFPTQDGRAGPRQPWIRFVWATIIPVGQDTSAWTPMTMNTQTMEFCTVRFVDDIVSVLVMDEFAGNNNYYRDPYANGRRRGEASIYTLQLCDPQVCIESKVAELALEGFGSLGHFLSNMDK
jgi:hypothetical protein